MPGRWEFPGGKLADGELPINALRRELREELGVDVEQATPLIRLHHDYAQLSVDLDFFRVEKYRGAPRPLEGQPLAWMPIKSLHECDLLEADRPIIAALNLPDRCWITPAPSDDVDAWLGQIGETIRNNVAMLQCRLPGDVDRIGLGLAVHDLCREHGVLFIWNGMATEAEALGADGLHVSARQLMSLDARPPITGWIGASCHTEAEVRQANRLGLDYVFIGTVQATPSHPDGAVLGWGAFEKLVAMSNLPAYAVGGMKDEDIEHVRSLGGQGIAAIRSLMRG